jgi:ABC-type glycerol-3-phosphate transport system substrate-binding protein
MVSALRLGDNGVGSGPLYGLPLLVHARDTVLFYNKAYLARAGADAPDGDKITWDDYLNLAKKLTFKASDGRTEIYGLRESNDYQFLEWQCGARAFGTNLISDDGRKAQFNTPEAKKFWDWLYDIHNTYSAKRRLPALRSMSVRTSCRGTSASTSCPMSSSHRTLLAVPLERCKLPSVTPPTLSPATCVASDHRA